MNDEYNDTNLGDPRETPDEKEIYRLQRELATALAERDTLRALPTSHGELTVELRNTRKAWQEALDELATALRELREATALLNDAARVADEMRCARDTALRERDEAREEAIKFGNANTILRAQLEAVTNHADALKTKLAEMTKENHKLRSFNGELARELSQTQDKLDTIEQHGIINHVRAKVLAARNAAQQKLADAERERDNEAASAQRLAIGFNKIEAERDALAQIVVEYKTNCGCPLCRRAEAKLDEARERIAWEVVETIRQIKGGDRATLEFCESQVRTALAALDGTAQGPSDTADKALLDWCELNLETATLSTSPEFWRVKTLSGKTITGSGFRSTVRAAMQQDGTAQKEP